MMTDQVPSHDDLDEFVAITTTIYRPSYLERVRYIDGKPFMDRYVYNETYPLEPDEASALNNGMVYYVDGE
jgi:hypothetical protein